MLTDPASHVHLAVACYNGGKKTCLCPCAPCLGCVKDIRRMEPMPTEENPFDLPTAEASKQLSEIMDRHRIGAKQGPYFEAVDTTKYGDELPSYTPGRLVYDSNGPAGPIGDEIEAMRTAYEALSALDPRSRMRTFTWLHNVFQD